MDEITCTREIAPMYQTEQQVAHERARMDDIAPRRDVTETKARMTMTNTELCRRCGFHPVSPRVGGYCSWDCHDADDEEEVGEAPETDDRAA